MEEKQEIKRKIKIPKSIVIVVLVLLFILSFVGGFILNYIITARETKVLNEIITILKQVGYVVDPKTGEFIEFGEDDFADAIVEKFLDEYSDYYTPEEYKTVIEQSRGHEQGVGVIMLTKQPIIVRVKGNSPAEKAGLIKDDIIIAGKYENGERVEISTTYQAISFMSDCAPDALITLTVLRNGVEKEISVQKGAYVSSYVTYYDNGGKYHFTSDTPNGNPTGKFVESEKMALPEDTCYIVFDGFEGDSLSQMSDALDFMGERGKSKLILDISQNGGGQMNILCGIAGYLIENGGKGDFVVACAKSKQGTENFTSGRYKFKEHIKKIAVIASENSASASECLIGALIHYGGAFSKDNLIIEKNANGIAKTYGKGIMQTTYGLLSGGAFKLTTAKIFWPDEKTSIHGTGVIASGENAVNVGGGIKRAIEILN